MTLSLFSWFCPAVPPRSMAAPATIAAHDWRSLLRDSRIWRFSLYYYFVFGCFLALLLWLPHYYMTAYQLPMDQALSFTLFFVATSSMVRGLGGYLAQRFGSRTINWSVFWICLCCLFFLSYPPTDLVIQKHPVPSRTRPLSAVAPMVLRLKTWESRSPPNLERNKISLNYTNSPIRHKLTRGGAAR